MNSLEKIILPHKKKPFDFFNEGKIHHYTITIYNAMSLTLKNRFLPFFVSFWIDGQINFFNDKKNSASLFYSRKKLNLIRLN